MNKQSLGDVTFKNQTSEETATRQLGYAIRFANFLLALVITCHLDSTCDREWTYLYDNGTQVIKHS